MHLIDYSKSLLENLYYLSGILILFSLLVGIVQLSLSKRTIDINSKRAAANLAASQVEIYLTRVIPLEDKLHKLRFEKKIIEVEIEIGDFSRKALIEKLGEKRCLEAWQARLAIIADILAVLNSLEAFSVYFIKEIADEEIAFSAVGSTFIHAVERLYFELSFCLRDEHDNSFQNTIKLYELWSKRSTKEKLQKEYKNLGNKLQSIQIEKLKPIGTK